MHIRPSVFVLLCAAAAAMSGCIIPIAPEFEDEPNLPPYIVESTPTVGEIVFKGASETTATGIEVTLADPNIHDTLYVRWLIDYPKYDPNTTRLARDLNLAPTGTVRRATLPEFPASCLLHMIARGLPDHRVLLSVSDRPFLDGETRTIADESRLDAVPEGAHRLRAMWLLKMECK